MMQFLFFSKKNLFKKKKGQNLKCEKKAVTPNLEVHGIESSILWKQRECFPEID